MRVLASEATGALGSQLFGYHPDRLPRRVIAEEEGRPIYAFSTDSPLRSMTGDLERLALFAGQSAGAVERVEPAAAIIKRIVAEATGSVVSVTSETPTDDLGRQLIASMPDALVVADAEGTIRSWNAGAERILGYTGAEALGRSLDIITEKAGVRPPLGRLRADYGDRRDTIRSRRVAVGSCDAEGWRADLCTVLDHSVAESGRRPAWHSCHHARCDRRS